MKVYELMAILHKCEAGSVVSVQRGPNLFAVELVLVMNEGPEVFLIGTGDEPGPDEVKP